MERSKLWIKAMKPPGDFASGKRQFPLTDYCFQSGFGNWRGYAPHDDNDDVRKFHNFSREFLLEFAHERMKEMVVFAVVLVTAAWPVIYMVITVVKLLIKGRPLDQ